MANKGIIFVVAIYICGTSCFVFFYESCMGATFLLYTLIWNINGMWIYEPFILIKIIWPGANLKTRKKMHQKYFDNYIASVNTLEYKSPKKEWK